MKVIPLPSAAHRAKAQPTAPLLLAPALVLAWLASLALNLLPGLLRPTDTALYLELAVTEITQLSLWVAAWAWVTHTRQQRTRLAEHTALAAGAGLLDNAVLSLALPWAFFAMGWPWPAGLYDISRTALITLTALLHLTLACEGLTPRRLGLWLLASTLALGLTAANSWIEHNDSEALDSLPYQPNLYPAIWVKTPEHGIDEGLKVMWEGWGEAQDTKTKP